jgi:hypothetical protein
LLLLLQVDNVVNVEGLQIAIVSRKKKPKQNKNQPPKQTNKNKQKTISLTSTKHDLLQHQT